MNKRGVTLLLKFVIGVGVLLLLFFVIFFIIRGIMSNAP